MKFAISIEGLGYILVCVSSCRVCVPPPPFSHYFDPLIHALNTGSILFPHQKPDPNHSLFCVTLVAFDRSYG